jgi:hypothetical protein
MTSGPQLTNIFYGALDHPGEGLFDLKSSSRPHPWKFDVKRFLVAESSARKWRGLFWATSLEKITGGAAVISFRPGGWMQESAVPRCAILSVRSTGDIGH